MKRKQLPFGTWPSPLTASSLSQASLKLREPKFVGNSLYWIEGRPQEKGREVLMKRDDEGNIKEITPFPFSAKSRVHEYGGGAYHNTKSKIIFTNGMDNRLYQVSEGNKIEALTPVSSLRFSDGSFDENYQRSIWVVEDHSINERTPEALSSSQTPPTNYLALINENGEVRTIVEGNDFYAAPRVNAAGDQLAWLAWNHPNMPWDHTQLWVGKLTPEGEIREAKQIALEQTASFLQPEWGSDGNLYFLSDDSNWWNLYSWDGQNIVKLIDLRGEIGGPSWNFGESYYTFLSNDEILATYNHKNQWSLGRLHLPSKEFTPYLAPFTFFSRITASQGRIAYFAANATTPLTLYLQDFSAAPLTLYLQDFTAAPPNYFPPPIPICSSTHFDIATNSLSLPIPMEFPTTKGMTAHAFFYPPTNAEYEGTTGEKPPLIVFSHGGPTGASESYLNLNLQFWTNRGFAVLDVNYRGSTGYGRAYRSALYGQWGIDDVEDCIAGANALVTQGLVDRERIAIRGGSAGGYTTLCALTFHDFFKVGAIYYGVSDLEALARDTHKFESQYDRVLIGSDDVNRYRERSPCHWVEKLNCPLIFFQGEEDRVVPKNQTETMVNALKQKQIPVEYWLFEGEGHGFRQSKTIETCLMAEQEFYSKTFKLPSH